jgi:peptide/nickel transport system ATP-binding protein
MKTTNDHPLLEIEGLKVNFNTRSGIVQAVRGVNLEISAGETLGLVGESGSGKSVTVQAAMGLISSPGKIMAGNVRWQGQSLFGSKGKKYLKQVRGKEISMIFQDAMVSLNPIFTIGTQIGEVLTHHMKMTKKQARARTIELIDLVGISAPETRLNQYPYEYSGGMLQRIMIAMALACNPKLLIADEPTTALDVTIQAQILELIASLQERLNLSVIMITHDLGVIAQVCHRVAVMYAGKIVEVADVDDIFEDPQHPYTKGLLKATPRPDIITDRMIEIEGVPPNLINLPEGCAFSPRCSVTHKQCANPPIPDFVRGERYVSCWRSI